MYNIGYGGVHEAHVKQLLDDPTKEEELISAIK
jgi:hypothetical protein